MTEDMRVDELVDSQGNVNIDKTYNVYQHDFSSFDEFEKRKERGERKRKPGKLEEFMI